MSNKTKENEKTKSLWTRVNMKIAQRIEDAAAKNGRSVASEIKLALEEKYAV